MRVHVILGAACVWVRAQLGAVTRMCVCVCAARACAPVCACDFGCGMLYTVENAVLIERCTQWQLA